MKKILYFIAIFALAQTQLLAVPLTVINNSNSNLYNGLYNVTTYVNFSKAGNPCDTGWGIPYNFPIGSATTLNGSSIWTSPWNNQNFCLGDMVGNCGDDLDWHWLRIESMNEISNNINYYSGPINLINNNCISNNYFPNDVFPTNSNFTITNTNFEYIGVDPISLTPRFRITYNVFGSVLALLNFE